MNMAGMAVGVVTMGATFTTNWSRCGMAKLNTVAYICPPAANMALKGLRVQMVTSTVRIRNGLISTVQASGNPGEASGSAPSDIEGRAVVRKFLMMYLTYTPANIERQYADALNMMTLNFRTLTMNKFREDDTLGKVKTDSITSSIKIRSIEPVAGMPWVYQVFAAKEVHRLNSQRIEYTEKMVCRYPV